MKKALIWLLQVCFVLFCYVMIIMIIDKRRVDSNENVDSIENYEKLVIEELVEIYGSDVYGYIIEELECKGANEDIKYCCLVRFYDGEIYVERIMYVRESGFVYTEVVLEEVEK